MECDQGPQALVTVGGICLGLGFRAKHAIEHIRKHGVRALHVLDKPAAAQDC